MPDVPVWLKAAARRTRSAISETSGRERFMEHLTPETYDAAEAAGAAALSNRVIEASGTVTFASLGYPTRAQTLGAVGRYVDVMHEGRSEATFRDILCGGITQEEFALLERVTQAVCANSEKLYGRRRVATASLLRALAVVRAIRILYPDRDSPVLEVGAGSGYVGALLLADGYPYACTDIAQGFYLHQSHILQRLASAGFIELATDRAGFGEIRQLRPGQALHIPWWKFYAVDPQIALRVAVVTCNHALAEMHPNGRSYVLTVAHRMLDRARGSFIFEGWGSTVNTPIWAVAKRFADLGYVIAHNNVSASMFVPQDGALAEGGLRLPVPPRSDPVFEAADYASGGFVQQYHPPIYQTPHSTLSRRYVEGMEAVRASANVDIAAVFTMMRRHLGTDDLATDDERFSVLVGSPY